MFLGVVVMAVQGGRGGGSEGGGGGSEGVSSDWTSCIKGNHIRLIIKLRVRA